MVGQVRGKSWYWVCERETCREIRDGFSSKEEAAKDYAKHEDSHNY